MLIALAIQPEIILMMRKVIFSDSIRKEEEEAVQWNDCLLTYYQKIDDHLTKLYGITRAQYADEMDQTVGDLWADIDEYMLVLKELLTDDKAKQD